MKSSDSRALCLVLLSALAILSTSCRIEQTASPVDPEAGLGQNGTAPIKIADEQALAIESPVVSINELQEKGSSGSVWSHTLYRAGASYICPHFSSFNLPPGAVLVVRSPDGAQSYAYTGQGKEHPDIAGRDIWTAHINGDTAVLELYSDVPIAEGALVMDRVAHGLPQFENAPGTQAICGVDDMREAACFQNDNPAVYQRSRAVARLVINGSSGCTGFLVGSEGHLLTNAHCIETAGAAANTNYEFLAEGTACTTDCRARGACAGIIEATSAQAIKIARTFDYTLVKLPNNVSNEYGFLQLRDEEASIGEQIYIPQHPRRWGKQVAFNSSDPNNPNGFCQIDATNRNACTSGATYNDIGYFCDTAPGSSGAPVLGYADHLVVALHHCGTCSNRGIPTGAIINDLGAALPANAVANGDSAPPSIQLENLVNGAVVNGVVSLLATATSTIAITRVEFHIDGSLVNTDTVAPYTFDWDTTITSDGPHTIEALASDTAGKTSSYSVSVIVSNNQNTLSRWDLESGFGAWDNVTTDTDDWILNQGATPSSNTGPNHDNTLGTASGTYAYLETSSGYANSFGDDAILESPLFDGDTYALSFSFSYHMYGTNMGTLHVDILYQGQWQSVFAVSGRQHSDAAAAFTQANVDLQNFSGPIKIRIRATAVGGYRGDMAIDDGVVTALRRTAPPPPSPTRLSFEDFENGFTDWKNTGGDFEDWRLQNGATPSSYTGPSRDHTSGTDSGTYAYLETSSGYANDLGNDALLESVAFDGDTYALSLQFFYHMYGRDTGTLHVDVLVGGAWQTVVSIAGQQQSASGAPFAPETIDLSSFNGPVTVRFRSSAAGGYRGDIALDDILIAGQPRP